MKKIYILTEGSYSDYHIVGVAEDKETAELLSEKWDCGIEEYNINTIEDAKYIQNKTLYEVTMWKNGNSEVKKDSYGTSDAYPEPTFRIWGGVCCGIETIVDINCWADSPEHAVKIANEKRAELIATGRWDEEEKVLKIEQEEYIKSEKSPYRGRAVINEDGSCSHRYILASEPVFNEAFYHKDGELYKIYRCQYCYEIVKEERVEK